MSFDTFDPEQWHPVRLPGVSEPADQKASRQMTEMTDWCEKHCEQAWLHVQNQSHQTVFWFEADTDAVQFSLNWFPLRYL